MDILKIPPRSKDGNVYAFVEIPAGSQNKYEYDKDLGVITLDRTLYSAVHFPTDYGFVPGTRSSDGEFLDIMVLDQTGVFPGCLMETRLIGMLTITHTDGKPEQKLLAVPAGEPYYAEYQDLADMPQHMRKEIEHFFEVYKDLEGSDVGVQGWEDAGHARHALDEAVETYERDR